jgi:hypothetical protein
VSHVVEQKKGAEQLVGWRPWSSAWPVMAAVATFTRGGAKRSQGRGGGGEWKSGDAQASTTEGAGGARHASRELGPWLEHGGHALGHASALEAFRRLRGRQQGG